MVNISGNRWIKFFSFTQTFCANPSDLKLPFYENFHFLIDQNIYFFFIFSNIQNLIVGPVSSFFKLILRHCIPYVLDIIIFFYLNYSLLLNAGRSWQYWCHCLKPKRHLLACSQMVSIGNISKSCSLWLIFWWICDKLFRFFAIHFFRLRDRLVKIITDYRTETSLRHGCNDILNVLAGFMWCCLLFRYRHYVNIYNICYVLQTGWLRQPFG